MDPVLQELQRRSRAIPPAFAPLAEGVRRAITLAEQDADAALVRCRRELERVVRPAFERRVGEPAGNRPLNEMVQRLVKDGHMPRRVAAYANVVRELGNIGAHETGSDRDEPVGVDDVAYAVDQLLEVIEWHIKGEAPESPAAGPADASSSTSSSAPVPPAARPDPPRLLPYLCDRSEQEEQLREALADWSLSGDGRAIVCVVHGAEDQCHDQFLDRVRLRLLPRVLGLDAARGGARQYPVECPTEPLDPARFGTRFLAKLHDRVVDPRGRAADPPGHAVDPRAMRERVAAALAGQPGPVLIRSHLMTDDWILSGPGPFREFCRFWADWPGSGPKTPLIACLLVTYRLEVGMGWLARNRLRKANAGLNRFLKDLARANDPGVRTLVLSELLGVTRTDAVNWAHELSSLGPALPDEVARMFDRISGSGLGSRVAMKPLGAALETLLRETALVGEF
ncbi:MAG: DUF4145 domain-containing protein [Isosphaeraceae bacterium]